MNELTFAHSFSRSVSCTIRVPDQAPSAETILDIKYEWDGRPKVKHTAEYRQWVLVTVQILCDRWQAKILYCLGTKPNETELWRFEPGCTPVLAEKLSVGIP